MNNTMSDKEITTSWSQGNDAGLGFPVGAEGQSPWDAAEAEGYEHIREFDTNCELGTNVVAWDGSDWVAICSGPWAVVIPEACQ